MVFAAALATIFMAAIEGTIVATAMPTIVGALGGIDLFSWIFGAYLLTQAILIPIYNAYILLKIAGRPGWWLILYFIPLVNFVIAIIVAIDIARAFGQGAVFGFFLLFLLCGIGYLILGFGDYRYQGPPTVTG